jgi:hypothetical protein
LKNVNKIRKYFKQLTDVVVASTGLLAASVGIQTEFASSRGAGIARGVRRTIVRVSTEVNNQRISRIVRHASHVYIQVVHIANNTLRDKGGRVIDFGVGEIVSRVNQMHP